MCDGFAKSPPAAHPQGPHPHGSGDATTLPRGISAPWRCTPLAASTTGRCASAARPSLPRGTAAPARRRRGGRGRVGILPGGREERITRGGRSSANSSAATANFCLLTSPSERERMAEKEEDNDFILGDFGRRNTNLALMGEEEIKSVVQKGTGGWKKIVKAFGRKKNILLENGEIDRALLGQIVFSNPAKRQLLNRLLAPHISSGIFWEILKLWMKGCKVIIVDVPLLFETKMDQWINPVIVVWVNPETQMERLMSRDWCSEEHAQNRINAQLALDCKKPEADIVIDNSGSLDDTKEQFQEVLRKVSEPVTWKERLRSRDGLFCVVLCTAVGVLLAQKNLLGPLHA